ncbi:MAG: hypothetical protein DDT40_01579 [candidate division WS2 bacterium]|uniref:Uncharacterized protein n=1 Tax=Psychracetigena formicireducens TaxID=2986056 RepID=A0A9E2BH55_PSYF1|nr:hypothetical protein [Candidatus Psychracetigena formicireducens]MBT9144516.1 hypothetical protein [Candidatus Psychracetigena formicireducens]MBT9151386.1 hypothetical protein [Candidatus Psychracetigena formicireducens]
MILKSEFDENVNSLFIAIRFLRTFFSISTKDIQDIINYMLAENSEESSIHIQDGIWKILNPKIKELPLWSVEMIKFFFDKNPRDVFETLRKLLDSEENSEFFHNWLENFIQYLASVVSWQDPDILRRIENLYEIIDDKEQLPYQEIKRAFFGNEKYFKGDVGLTWILTPVISLPRPWLLIINRLEGKIWEKESIQGS